MAQSEMTDGVLIDAVRTFRNYIEALGKRGLAVSKAARQGERRALISLLAGAIVSLIVIWGLWSWRVADVTERKARHDRAVADFGIAQQHFRDDATPVALAYLAHAVRLDPNWAESRNLLVDLLQRKSWSLPIAILSHQYPVWFADVTADGKRVVTAAEHKSAWLWDGQTGKLLGKAMPHQSKVWSARFSPDGSRVVTTSRDNIARLWDGKTGEGLGAPMAHEGDVKSAQFSSDGKRVVTASLDNTARLWDARTGTPIGEPMRHGDWVKSARFSFDGARVVTASLDRTARLWDGMTGRPVGEPMAHEGGVESAAFSPDGSYVVTASTDGAARLWDGNTGQPIGEPMRHGAEVWSAEFSPDGARVVTASQDNQARLWNGKTGAAIGVPMRHQAEVWSARFSPDGLRVVTASEDKTARLWDAYTGKALGEPMVHDAAVWSAQFSADGRRVLTVSYYGMSARLWDGHTGQAVDDGTETSRRGGTAMSGDVTLLADLAEAVAGLQLAGDAIEPVPDPAAMLSRLRKLSSDAPMAGTSVESFVRWFLSDPYTRTVSPGSALTVPNYIKKQIAEGRRAEVEHTFPGHALFRGALNVRRAEPAAR